MGGGKGKGNWPQPVPIHSDAEFETTGKTTKDDGGGDVLQQLSIKRSRTNKRVRRGRQRQAEAGRGRLAGLFGPCLIFDTHCVLHDSPLLETDRDRPYGRLAGCKYSWQ